MQVSSAGIVKIFVSGVCSLLLKPKTQSTKIGCTISAALHVKISASQMEMD